MNFPGGLVKMKITQVRWRKFTHLKPGAILGLYLFFLGQNLCWGQETLLLDSCRGREVLKEDSGIQDVLQVLATSVQQLREETQQLRREVQQMKEQLGSADPAAGRVTEDKPGNIRTQVRSELRTQLRSLRRDVMTAVRRDLDLVKRTVSGVLAAVTDSHRELTTNVTEHWSRALEPLTDMCPRQLNPGAATPDLGPGVTSNFKDCTDVWFSGSRVNGSYFLRPNNAPRGFVAYCEFDVNGAWTVFQRRQDGSVNFYRGWDDYKVGFGDIRGEHWLGNAHIHELTNQGTYRLAIDMWDWRGGRGNYYHTEADSFWIDDESSKFRLHVPSDPDGYSGYFGAGLRVHAGPFCTRDRNNLYGRENCAETFHCGWWFTTCVTNANLNGRWFQDGYVDPSTRKRARDDIYWPHINQSLKKVVMKLKRESLDRPTDSM